MCCSKHAIGKALWVLAAISLILAWVSGSDIIFGADALTWYINAIVLGILAIPLKIGRCGSCLGMSRHCGCGSGDCPECEMKK